MNYERLTTLRQSRIVEEYILVFEVLVAQSSIILKELGIFHGGLRAEIKCRVCTHDPREITGAINIARDVEEDLLAFRLIDDTQFQAPISYHKHPLAGGIVTRVGFHWDGTALVGFSNVVLTQGSSDVVKNAFALTKHPDKGVQGVYTTPAYSALNSSTSSINHPKHRGLTSSLSRVCQKKRRRMMLPMWVAL